jgi:hypothetical protein
MAHVANMVVFLKIVFLHLFLKLQLLNAQLFQHTAIQRYSCSTLILLIHCRITLGKSMQTRVGLVAKFLSGKMSYTLHRSSCVEKLQCSIALVRFDRIFLSPKITGIL